MVFYFQGEKSNMNFEQLSTVIQYLALKDQCQHLASRGYSANFCLQIMPKIEELIHNNLEFGDLMDFWVEQTKEGKSQT